MNGRVIEKNQLEQMKTLVGVTTMVLTEIITIFMAVVVKIMLVDVVDLEGTGDRSNVAFGI